MTSIPEHLRDIALACDQLEKQLAEQKHQIDALAREVEALRRERDDYWALVQTILGDDVNRNPAGWEAMIQVGMKHGVDFTKEVHELIADMEHLPSEM